MLSSILAVCNAQYVNISCVADNANTKLDCKSYTLTYSANRTVVFDVPAPALNSKVIYIKLQHPALDYFLVEIFNVFPNLKKLSINSDGSSTLPPRAFRNAKNLVDFRVVASKVVSTIDFYVFIDATRLERLAYTSVSHINRNAFVGLNNLVTLDLSFSAVGQCPTPLSINIFYPLVNLKEIFLWSMNVTVIPTTMFAKNKKLEWIHISDELQAVESTFIDHLPNIKRIDISKRSGNGCVAVNIHWASPQPISDFHETMAQCYAKFAMQTTTNGSN